MSVAAFLVTAGVLVSMGRRLSATAGWVASFIAAGLWLTAAPVIEAIGLRALTDGPAIAVTGLTLWALAGALERPTRSRFVLVGLLSVATYLTKTGFGVVLIPSILLTFAVWARSDDGPRVDARSVVAYLAPIVVVGILWFAYPPKIAATFSALTNRAQGPSPLSWAGLTYHPRQLADDVGGWSMLALLGIAVAMAALRRSPPIVVTLVLYVAVALGLHTLSHTKDPKHVTKVVPWLFLLRGMGRIDRRLEVGARGRGWPVAMGVGAVLCAVLAARAHNLFATPRQRADTLPRVRSALVPRGSSPIGTTWYWESSAGWAALSPSGTSWSVTRPRCSIPTITWSASRLCWHLCEPGTRGSVRSSARPPSGRSGWTTLRPATKRTSARRIGCSPSSSRRMRGLRILVLEIAPTSPWYDDRDFVFGGETFLPALGAEACYRRTEVVGPERGVSLSVWDSVPGCGLFDDAGSGSEPAAYGRGARPGEAVGSPLSPSPNAVRESRDRPAGVGRFHHAEATRIVPHVSRAQPHPSRSRARRVSCDGSGHDPGPGRRPGRRRIGPRAPGTSPWLLDQFAMR